MDSSKPAVAAGKRSSKGLTSQKNLDEFFKAKAPSKSNTERTAKLSSASPHRKRTKSAKSANAVRRQSDEVHLKFVHSPRKPKPAKRITNRPSLYPSKGSPAPKTKPTEDIIDCTPTQAPVSCQPARSETLAEDDDIIDCTPDVLAETDTFVRQFEDVTSKSTHKEEVLGSCPTDLEADGVPHMLDMAVSQPSASQDSILGFTEAIEANLFDAPPPLPSEGSLVQRLSSQMTVTPSPKQKRSSAQRRATSARPADAPAPSQPLHRLVVNSMQAGGSHDEPELRLAVEHVASATRLQVVLQQDWLQTPVSQGSVIEIVPFSLSDDKEIVVCNDGLRLLIFEPDRLLTSTRIAGSFECPRKAVLAERFKSLDVTTDLMVWGTMLHEVFQTCLAQQDFASSNIRLVIEEVIAAHIQSLYGVDKTEKEARDHMLSFVDMLHGWGTSYVRDDPSASVNLDAFNHQQHQDTVSIVGLADIEENCWVPRLGMKGMIDATVTIKLKRTRLSQVQPWRKGENTHQESGIEIRTVPFELKTGRHVQGGHPEHRAQVILYSLMMADQGSVVEAGLLHYLKSGDTYGVAVEKGEVRALVIARNELALFASRPDTFPDMLGDKHACSRCFSLDLCSMVHSAYEHGTKDTSGLDNEFELRTSHLTQAHKEYFSNALLALNAEAAVDNDNLPSELWKGEPDALEASGWTVCQLGVVDGGNKLNTRQRHCYEYTFQRVDNPDEVSPHDVLLSAGDSIVLSCQAPRVRFAVATGIIGVVGEATITCLFEQPLRSHIAEPESPIPTQAWLSATHLDRAVYRIDKARYGSNVRSQLSAVAGLLVSGKPVFHSKTAMQASQLSQGDASNIVRERRRALVVDLAKPVFRPQLQPELQVEIDALPLNSGQKGAISHVLCAQDYALVQGMPGTGKTTVISQLVQLLVSRGKRVLLSAYTHSAVDNVMLKLKPLGVNMLRLGNAHSVHADIVPYLLNELQDECSTVAAMHDLYRSAAVVGTTCLGANHMLLSKQRFDYCIVDEASQITQAVSFQPLSHADVFVLVGDHKQLPPLVRSVEARRLGMGISLFKRLSDAHPTALTKLTRQYRMNASVMHLANKLFYRDQLECGSDAVATARLELPEVVNLLDTSTCPSFVQRLLDPNESLLYLDTSHVDAPETKDGKIIRNPLEAELVVQLTRLLLAVGLDEADIGIICPYRAQLALINTLLRDNGHAQVEVNTVDRYQGRDKRIILVSFVRSNENAVVGDLLKDWRRINVAITRAKQKLVLCGSASTLQSDPVCARLLELCQASNCLAKLPPSPAEAVSDVVEQAACAALFQEDFE
eukprot:m.212409 g.212409  ORF g.212409 m.212409 type:complete len:1320 (-) comp17161_c0_seq2:6-3965(-)